MRRRRALVVLTLSAVAAAGAAAPGASAASAAASLKISTVVGGLDNPRGLSFTSQGLLVAQAGRGGSGACLPGAEGLACLGFSGKISAVSQGKVRDVLTGLPSLAGEGGVRAIGPSDVTETAAGDLIATVGLGADPSAEPVRNVLAHAPNLASVITKRPGLGPLEVADIAAHEIVKNPQKDSIDTNPNSVATAPGAQVVADAGGNALLRVERGKVSTLAVFPTTLVDAPSFLGLPPGTQIPMQAVPNSVVRGPDGAWYVGQLTGFPFPVGGAKVWRVVPGKAPTVYASGFTNIIDLAFLPNGALLVLEIRHQSLLSPDRSGGLMLVPPKSEGAPRLLLTSPLTEPGGLAVQGRTAYVSDRGTEPGTGRVLRINGF